MYDDVTLYAGAINIYTHTERHTYYPLMPRSTFMGNSSLQFHELVGWQKPVCLRTKTYEARAYYCYYYHHYCYHYYQYYYQYYYDLRTKPYEARTKIQRLKKQKSGCSDLTASKTRILFFKKIIFFLRICA